jgi:hypothetical protein
VLLSEGGKRFIGPIEISIIEGGYLDDNPHTFMPRVAAAAASNSSTPSVRHADAHSPNFSTEPAFNYIHD